MAYFSAIATCISVERVGRVFCLGCIIIGTAAIKQPKQKTLPWFVCYGAELSIIRVQRPRINLNSAPSNRLQSLLSSIEVKVLGLLTSIEVKVIGLLTCN